MPDATEQETLARARALRGSRMGYAAIAKALTEEGRPTKRGGAWATMSVRSVLRTSANMQGQSAA